MPQRLPVTGILPVTALQLLLDTSVTRAKLGCSEEADEDVLYTVEAGRMQEATFMAGGGGAAHSDCSDKVHPENGSARTVQRPVLHLIVSVIQE